MNREKLQDELMKILNAHCETRNEKETLYHEIMSAVESHLPKYGVGDEVWFGDKPSRGRIEHYLDDKHYGVGAKGFIWEMAEAVLYPSRKEAEAANG